MADTDASTSPENTAEAQLEGGSYQVIRNRLQGLNQELTERVERLNAKRRDVFGQQESSIIGQDRVQTENNCVPRDIVHVGQQLIFGYNVFIGLKSEIELDDVFSVYEFDGNAFRRTPAIALDSGSFVRDFQSFYRYYKSARFLCFRRDHQQLLVVFQQGDSIDHVKVFRFQIDRDESMTYVDDRSEALYSLPKQHDFRWVETTRDDQQIGAFPHVSIADRVFVETIGGDLTIKIEDNTETGEGIYAEPVENRDQSLDDAEISYAIVGNLILLRILPYLEENRRYFIFNEKTRSVVRIDSIEQACIRLPEDHGIIFPRGYYLQDGTNRTFQEDTTGMDYLTMRRSPNGEDFLYVFHHRALGHYILLQYNVITKTIANPITCHGYTIFADGKMVLFHAPDDEPRKVHAMQIWQTAFYTDTHEVVRDKSSYLNRIGNPELVKAISECYAVGRFVAVEKPTAQTYQDLLQTCTDILDSYHWLAADEVFDLESILQEVRSAAIAAIDEYDKVVRVREETQAQIAANEAAVDDLLKATRYERMESVDAFVDLINQMRSRRGQVITLRELKFCDEARVTALEKQLQEATERASLGCVDFLMSPAALAPYQKRIEEVKTGLAEVGKIADLKPLDDTLEDTGKRLDLLTDVVNNLNIEDSTKTTAIVDRITDVFAALNRVKAETRNLRGSLGKSEAAAEFGAQFKLLSQSIANYIGLCDTPAKCDDYLTRLMITIEELEGRFADYEEYVEQLLGKREEAYSAFASRKQVLEEELKRRTEALLSSAQRILKGVRNRCEALATVEEVNAYFASDLMIGKLREVIEKLRNAGNTVQAEDLDGQLKKTRDDAMRRLRDRMELFDEGDDLIKFGDYRFTVNTQPLDLTTVLRDDTMYFHLTGTDYYEPITDPEFLSTRDLWGQELVSEAREVYRAEYLAYLILTAAIDNRAGLQLGIDELAAKAKADDATALADVVRGFSADRYNEGYEKGIHDHDATLILRGVVELYETCELLRYDSESRAHAILFWCFYGDQDHKARWRNKVRSFGYLADIFGYRESNPEYISELYEAMRGFFADLWGVEPSGAVLRSAAEFLFWELQDRDDLLFTINALAHELYERFRQHLQDRGFFAMFEADVASLQADLRSRLALIRDWVGTYVRMQEDEESRHLQLEVVALVAAGEVIQREQKSISTYRRIEGLLGQHRQLEGGSLDIYLDRWLLKLNGFVNERVPLFEKYTRRRTELTAKRREEMRLGEFASKVMGGFVRNRLINDVYLPLVGANFAKQMGAAGEAKRTDLMGLLLLISPPGYGKTTLMEYLANRLGLTFMKINGPAIGHSVTSLDPKEAPNATAVAELQKLNMSFEMGNNVMIYVDDIQHCNPEFLQKFISLCDAQRKIEGVWQGTPRTYDLRGKKVVVVMAGNPYTESGHRFQIPDMLSNRADTYNLGDVSSTAQDSFALSFIENAMTSNPVLSRISSRSHEDLYRFMRVLESGSQEGVNFDYDYSAAEVAEILNVLKKMRRIQEVVLKVNEQYIHSAAQAEEYRTEPPFKLQGSYRNMNRMAEKVYAVMTDDEVEQLIRDHYYNEAQVLTAGAEANILKFKEVLGVLDEESAERWEAMKKEFNRRQLLAGVDDSNQFGQVIAQLSAFGGNLQRIHEALESGLGPKLAAQLGGLRPTAADLAPLVQAIERSGGGDGQGEALAAAVRESSRDVSEALKASLARSGEASGAPAATGTGSQVDFTPLVTALQELRQERARLDFPEDYAKAWERQVTAIECLLPIMESIKVQSDAFLQLRVVLENLVNGVIQVEVKR